MKSFMQLSEIEGKIKSGLLLFLRIGLPPPATTVKINFDAAVSVKRNVEAVAALARNSQGLPLGWSCKLHPAIVDPLFLETLAGQEDVFLTHRMGLRSIILEGDAKQVIDFVKGRIFMETCGAN